MPLGPEPATKKIPTGPQRFPGNISPTSNNDLMGEPSDTPPVDGDAHASAAPTPEATPPSPDRTPAPPRPKRQWGRTAARQAAAVSSKLAPVVRGAGDRVAAASATTLLSGLLGALLISSVIAGLTSNGSLGVAATVLFIPMLSGVIGAIGMRCLDERRRAQAQLDNEREETRTLQQIEHTLDYVDTKLTTALTQFGTDRHNEAVIGMFQAKAATELYLGTDRRAEARSAPDSEAEGIDLVSQYGLAELLTPRSVGSKSDRSCA